MIEKPWESEDLLIRLSFWAFKFCGKGEQENMASDTMSEAKTRIEELERYQSLHAQCEKVSLELEKKLVEQLKIAHSRLPQWQPIETAPKDGTLFLAFVKWKIRKRSGQMIEIISWEKDDKDWISLMGGLLDKAFTATHWMPLPEPPKP
jgi:hypothetical protein